MSAPIEAGARAIYEAILPKLKFDDASDKRKTRFRMMARACLTAAVKENNRGRTQMPVRESVERIQPVSNPPRKGVLRTRYGRKETWRSRLSENRKQTRKENRT